MSVSNQTNRVWKLWSTNWETEIRVSGTCQPSSRAPLSWHQQPDPLPCRSSKARRSASPAPQIPETHPLNQIQKRINVSSPQNSLTELEIESGKEHTVSSSTSILAKSTSVNLAAMAWMAGSMSLQGPHHDAEKSITSLRERDATIQQSQKTINSDP